MLTTLLLTFSILFLASCGEQTVTKSIEITPGCKLYTVEQSWWQYDVYTTICDTDRQESSSYKRNCGKSCTRDVDVKTVHKTPISDNQ